MSNLAKIYGDATGKGSLARERAERLQQEQNKKAEPRPIETIQQGETITEQELTSQNKIDWLSHPRTRELFKWLGSQIKDCENRSKQLSNTIHVLDAKFDTKLQMSMYLFRACNLEEVLIKFSK